METELTQLKCGDCEHCAKYGWPYIGRWCDNANKYVVPDQPACISVLPKLSARERRECKDKPRTH